MSSPAISSSATAKRWSTIVKPPPVAGLEPNLRDYGRAWAEFSWADARHRLDDDPLQVFGVCGGFERKGHDQS